uniref:Reverse transcriptase domain-containing protein n=1 Tax=Tanacetum cinerariifolium TaxID=118510 RepID=A0A6L2J628_TANCI|nr:reverse transcriptase domain-containing protein [Tanacetum cinerariifolium]
MDIMKISSFMDTHKCPELAKRYSDKVPKTMDEMMTRLDDFVRSKEAFASTELPKGEVSEASRRSAGPAPRDQGFHHPRFNLSSFTKLPKEILASEPQLNLQPPRPMQLLPKKENQDKYYASDEPLIIEAVMEGYLVRRVYVDQGASMEMMFEHLFENWSPAIRSRLRDTQMDLVGFAGGVVKPLGKNDLEVVFGDDGIKIPPSGLLDNTLHGPIARGVTTLVTRSAIISECRRLERKQMVAQEFNQSINQEKEVPKRVDLTEQTLVNPAYPDQLITIWGNLSDQCKNQLRILLKKSMDVFAWEPADMTGIPKRFIEHSLNVKPSVEPVAQKRRVMTSDRTQVQMAQDDEEKTAFYTDQGTYCYTKMPFRLKNVGFTYQRDEKGHSRSAAANHPNKGGNDIHIRSSGNGGRKCRTTSRKKRDTMSDTLRKQDVEQSQEKLCPVGKTGPVIVAHVQEATKKVLVEVLAERSTDQKEVGVIVEEEEDSWMTPIIRQLRHQGDPHGIMRNAHIEAKFMVAKAIRHGYYWPTMHRDARNMTQKRDSCQVHAPVPRRPKTLMTSIMAPWPFYQWGLDILGPLPQASGKLKFIIVVIDYFTKWIEAKPLVRITEKDVKKFAWKNIVCRFWLPRIIVTDSGTQFVNEKANKSLMEGIKAILGRERAGWVNELPNVLWAHRTSLKQSNGETTFSLTYESEAVIPVEIGMPTHRTMMIREDKNEDELCLNMNLLQERREAVAIREAKYKTKMEQYYNQKVRPMSFKPDEYVLKE